MLHNRIKSCKRKQQSAFTMAEVLITILVIGMVATLVMPSVITRIKINTYITQLKKCHNHFGNALKGIIAQNVVTRLSDTKLWVKIPEQSIHMENIVKDEYKPFINELSKSFKVVSVHNKNDLIKNYEYKIKSFNNEFEETPSGLIFLADDTYLYLRLYKSPVSATCGSRKCYSLREFQNSRKSPSKFWQIAGYLIVDVNGRKEPNTYGRDVFIFYLDDLGTLYPEGGREYAIYYANDSSCSDNNNLSSCKYHWSSNSELESCVKNSVKYGYGCAGRVVEENWQMKY